MQEMTVGGILILATIIVVAVAIPVTIMTLRVKTGALSYFHNGIVVEPGIGDIPIIQYRAISRGQVVGDIETAYYVGSHEGLSFNEIPDTHPGQKVLIYVDLHTGRRYWDLAETRLRDFNLYNDDRFS